MSRNERIAWVGLLGLTLVLRFAWLGARPPHHDEAVHADFGHNLMAHGTYRYDPTYHGPLLFYVMAPIFVILGESDFTARLYPALAGVALVALPFALRRRIGGRAAWWIGACLAISPSFLYYARFARNELPVALFTALALTLFLLVRRSGAGWIPWIGAAAALHAISKETFYVMLPLLAVASAAVALHKGLWWSAKAAWRWLYCHRIAVLVACLWFVIITVTAYTFFFVHPEDLFFPGKAISYWYNQHKIQRVGGPWFYHLPRLALYEFLPILAALVWSIRRGRRIRSIELFCLVWGLASVGMFAYLGEKVPWLEVHQVLPFMLLAGLQLGRTFSARGNAWGRSVASLGLLATFWSAIASSFLYPTMTPSDPHGELIVFVQTTPEVGALASHGREIGRSSAGQLCAAVSGEATWPLSWQWKRLNVWWALPEPDQRPPLVVCDTEDELKARERLGAEYQMRQIPLRAWWVEEWSAASPGKVLKWFLTRRTWSPIGSTDVLVFERESAKEK